MANDEDIDFGEISESLNDKADRDFHNIEEDASVPYDIAQLGIETQERILGDQHLQEQIDAIESSSQIADIVADYAALLAYDTSSLSDNSIIEVLSDEEHDNAMSYYRWNSPNTGWNYVGSTAPTYTKSEADSTFLKLEGAATIDGEKTFTTTPIVGTVDQSNNSTKAASTEWVTTKLGNYQPTITGAATSITSSDLTSSRALVSNSSGKVAVSDVTSTELGYVSGVTSSIQTQIDSKVAKNDDITGATHTKITYDSKGLVTAGADLEVSDIPSIPLSKISDVTATAAEINQLHESTISKEDLEKLHSITASAEEINTLDGITASTSELNILDGVTATTSELNILDGVTATTAELNYVDGVTSNIQTQLDSKVAKNDDITPGTHTKITYDAKGLVTGGSDLSASDIPNITLDKISDITATAAELNVLDGITASTSELNILDGVTATATEINTLDGITATTSELNQLHDSGVVTSDLTKLHNITADASELNVLDGITATTTELNILDGVTADASELNVLDGITATTTELNVLDGITSTTSELNQLHSSNVTTTDLTKLHNVTADANELNVLDGITASTEELNILDGVTATATEINVLDGITASTTELNYVDGVTSNIQTQLDNRVEKTNNASKVYGTDASGNQTTYDYTALGKVDDVKVGTQSVVTNKIANLGTMAGETATDYSKTSAFADIAFSGSWADLSNTPTTISGYGITDAYTKTEIDGKLSAAMHFKGTKPTYNDLPSSGQEIGDMWNVLDTGSNYAWDGSAWDKLSETIDLTPYNNHIANTNNPHSVTKAQVGLGNVDNTSDTNKPISTATQGALDNKVDKTTGVSKVYGTDASGNQTTYDYSSFGSVDDVKVGTQSVVTNKIANLGTMAGESKDDYEQSITGAATTITSNDLTSNRALISNASGKVAVSDITSTELGYLDNVTSNIQTQLDSKVDENAAITAGTHTKITYDAKGLVTGGEDLSSSDIPSITLSKISDVTATATEVNVLDGITATTTELNYVDGVTSNIQTQLDSKVDENAAITAGTHTKITYDSKGLVTGGSDLTASDIPDISATYQPLLVSGTNIKTVNNNTLLGSGNVDTYPSQTGQSGKFLTTNGTSVSWGDVIIPEEDNVTITKNSSDKLQTVAVIDQSNTSSSLKVWSGTLAQYTALTTKDANTLYNITDDVAEYEDMSSYFVHQTGNETIAGTKTFSSTPVVGTLATSNNSTSAASTEFVINVLKAIYPVGSIYIGTQATCPMSTFFGTWELVSSGKALWTGNGTSGSGTTTNTNFANAPANTTIGAGLPDITGYKNNRLTGDAGGYGGALYAYQSESTNASVQGGNGTLVNCKLGFKASKSNSIYGSSATVQPPAYVVNVWRRTA